MMSDTGATVRVDGATAFQALERESKIPGTDLFKLNIKVGVGRLINRNKNASAEIAVKKVQNEIFQLSSREIVFRREMMTNTP